MNKNKREHIREQKKELGKFFYDLAKLSFAAMVLGALLTYFQSETGEISTNLWIMLTTGIVATLIFSLTANKLNK